MGSFHVSACVTLACCTDVCCPLLPRSSSMMWLVEQHAMQAHAPPCAVMAELCRLNEQAVAWALDKTYVFSTSFSLPAPAADEQDVQLVLHGVDTVAEVLVNGRSVAHVANYHRWGSCTHSGFACQSNMSVNQRGEGQTEKAMQQHICHGSWVNRLT